MYKFKNGSRFKGNAEEVFNELSRIRNEYNGQLQTEVVVFEANDPENPLHGHFEWDDEKAAHQHRLQTARQLIKAVVRVEDESDNQIPIFVHVSDPDEGVNYYQEISVATKSEFDLALERLRGTMSAIVRNVKFVEAAAKSKDQIEMASRIKVRVEGFERDFTRETEHRPFHDHFSANYPSP